MDPSPARRRPAISRNYLRQNKFFDRYPTAGPVVSKRRNSVYYETLKDPIITLFRRAAGRKCRPDYVGSHIHPQLTADSQRRIDGKRTCQHAIYAR